MGIYIPWIHNKTNFSKVGCIFHDEYCTTLIIRIIQLRSLFTIDSWYKTRLLSGTWWQFALWCCWNVDTKRFFDLIYFIWDVKVTEVKIQLSRFQTVIPVWIHIWWLNGAKSLMLLRRGALLFSRSYNKFQGHRAKQNCRFWPKLGVWEWMLFVLQQLYLFENDCLPSTCIYEICFQPCSSYLLLYGVVSSCKE